MYTYDKSKCQYCRYIKCSNVEMIPNLIELNNQNKSILNDVSAFNKCHDENNKCHVSESDKSSGLNFGGISCACCRKLFQRTVMFKIQYKCKIVIQTNAL